ncbi:MAG: energy transducer TonB [Bacteroidota bacterium]|nr:energy transducer TonB [Bacteroidota bacterium]
MSYLINNQQNLNEVIFANRNKSYGAYVIRSEYGNTIFKSLSIMILGFGTFMSLAFYFSNRNNSPEQNNFPVIKADTSVTIICNLKPDEPLELKQPEKGSSAPATTTPPENTLVNISDTVSVETHSVLNNTNLTTTTNSATTGTGNETVVATGGGTGATTTTVTTNPTELVFVDSAPEFEGGLSALYKFVSANVKYPVGASENGKGGTVYVKFVVDEKGKVGRLTLLNNVGYGMDEEALRVIAMIPNFKSPAKVKGEAVKVYYQLPIKFKLN